MSRNVMVDIINTRNTVKDVRELHHTLATEELFGITKMLSNFFIGGIKKVFSIFSNKDYKYGGIDNVKTTDLVTDLIKSRSTINKIAENCNYTIASKIMIPVPIGMYVDYETAVREITTAMSKVEPTINKALDEVYTMLSKVLADPDFRKTNRPHNISVNIDNINREVVRHIEKVINPNFQYDRQPYSKLAPNVKSLVGISEALIASSKDLSQKQLEHLDEKITGITRTVDKLIEVASDKNDEFNINKNTAKHLVETIEDAANYVTTTVSLYQLNHMLIGSVLQCVEQLKKC